MLIAAVVLATAFLAYANGGNDNFKGVATLYGSGLLGYRVALAWATVTTLAGSAASIFLAELLTDRFSGKGLVPDVLTEAPEFLVAVALGAGATVIVASLTGFPISTTHGLTGALVGTGLVAAGSQVNFSVLGGAFLLPLLVSPLFAAILSAAGYYGVDRVWGSAFRLVRRVSRYGSLTSRKHVPPSSGAVHSGSIASAEGRLSGDWHTNICGPLDVAHLVSGGIVSFARGLNDTPKIVALLMVVEAVQLHHGVVLVAVAMGVGGLLHTRRVAANVATGLLVIAASRFSLPVSTTHVSVGAIFGLGAVAGDADLTAVWQIVLSWVLTLPIAAVLGGVTYGVLTRIL